MAAELHPAPVASRPKRTLLVVAGSFTALGVGWLLGLLAGSWGVGSAFLTGLGLCGFLIGAVTACSYALSRLRISAEGHMVIRSWPGQPRQEINLAQLVRAALGAHTVQDATQRLELADRSGATAFVRPGFWAAEHDAFAAIHGYARRAGAQLDPAADELLADYARRAASGARGHPESVQSAFGRHRARWLGLAAVAVVFAIVFEAFVRT